MKVCKGLANDDNIQLKVFKDLWRITKFKLKAEIEILDIYIPNVVNVNLTCFANFKAMCVHSEWDSSCK